MFRRRETASNDSDTGPVSPRALIRPPQASFDEGSASPRAVIRPPPSAPGEEDTAITLPSAPLAASPTMSPKSPMTAKSPSRKEKKAATQDKPKVLLKPLEIDGEEDNARTQQEFTLGKGVIRPLVSPMKQSKPDIFSRISFRKKDVVAPPAAPASPKEKAESVDDNGPTPTIAKPILDDRDESEVTARIAERRGWGKTLPTTNPMILHVLLKEANPFKKVRDVTKSSPRELIAALEATVYCVPRATTNASRFRFQRSDVVVVGCPRSGQTPILRILDALKEKSVRPSSSLVDSVIWVEAPYAIPSGALKSTGRRILKTHMPCENALKGDGRIMEHKVIVVVRDPADIRLSWYRQVRRLVKKCAHHSIDQNAGMAAFADASMPMPCNQRGGIDIHGMEPEYMIGAALKASHDAPENVLVVCYEQLFTDPAKVVENIARFTKFMQPEAPPKRAATSSGGGDEVEDAKVAEARKREEMELIYSIATGLMDDSCHPDSGKRNGSSGQGAVCFTRKVLEQLDDHWDRMVTTGASEFSTKINSYQHLYQVLTKEKYAFASDEKLAGGGSGSLFSRLSNLASSQTSSLGTEGSSRLKKKDSSMDASSVATATASTNNSRLKKQTSSAESEQQGKPRKLGGSFIKLFSGGSFTSGSSSSGKTSGTQQQALPLPERPVPTVLPTVYYCVDPDDSDDDMARESAPIPE